MKKIYSVRTFYLSVLKFANAIHEDYKCIYAIYIFKRFLSLYEGSCCHGNNTVYVLQDVTPRRTVTR